MDIKERRGFLLEGLYDTGSKIAELLIDQFKTHNDVILAIVRTKFT